MTDQDLFALAMAEIAEHGWLGFNLSSLATAPEKKRKALSLADIYDRFPTKCALLDGFGRHIDRQMIDVAASEMTDSSPKERIFELLMRRFDALQSMKPGLKRLYDERHCDPALMLATARNLGRMAQWLVALSNPSLKGLRRTLAEKAIAALYVRCFAVWLTDETDDSAKTMAEMDKRLGQLERLAQFGARRSQDSEAA